MNNWSKRTWIAGICLAAALALAACGEDSTLTIRNSSSYDLYEVYLKPAGARSWGSDLLDGDILAPGEQIEILDIDCGVYDAQVVDEDGIQCELLDEDLCFDDALWVIRDIDLAICAF